MRVELVAWEMATDECADEVPSSRGGVEKLQQDGGMIEVGARGGEGLPQCVPQHCHRRWRRRGRRSVELGMGLVQ
jgi:hypothetical protein